MGFVVMDSRETELIQQFKTLEHYSSDLFKSAALHLGDIQISDKIIIERKSWADLASSIMDGRYKEQSNRLAQAKSEGYTIYYFLEGNLDLYKPYGITKDSLRSCVYSLTYEKGFFVIMTKTTKETAEYIMKFYTKIQKTKDVVTPTPSSIVTKKKNSQIHKENISEMMLCQIPGISTSISNVLLTKWPTIHTILEELGKNPQLFEEFTYIKNDKTKRLNKNTIETLNHFLRK
jgi:ERCC4-type nuclease